nr:hypothetical protein [Tanacetum cinerariifolium]
MTTIVGHHPITIPRTVVTTATPATFDVTTTTPRHCRPGAIDKYIFASLEYELPPPDPHIPMSESVYPPSESAVVTTDGCNFMVHPLCVSTSSGSDFKRPNPEDVAELGTTLVYATVAEANNGFSFDASYSSSVYEVPTSSSSGSNASGGDDGGIFEAIIRGIGHMFEASSS